MPAPHAVLTLVENFERNLDAYRNGQYNETQVRRDFIDPLFKALGWDMDNSSGYAEAYRDVIHEDAIKVGTIVHAPDYSFRIGGTRKFFLEAKKPSVNVKDDIVPAFQLRRYGWSAKLSLSILTDFEEFAVYDCRTKPDKNDKSSKSRLFYCTYRDYADKWDEIAAIFSKDAVLKGSFDKYAISSKGKRGTTEVDSAFLHEIEGWRDLLARNIALRNNLSQRELNFAVQQTIDRIIFLRICEDRGIEPYGKLNSLQKGVNVYARLRDMFRDADDRYNSGLFHFKHEKSRTEAPDELTLGLVIDDKPLKEIFKNLYYPDCPYEFSVLGADILGSVYEQFLGKVIRLTSGNRAVVEDKPEVKKAGGVFYTPAYIVKYIVQHTVGKLLEGKTSKQATGLSIVDPACGSGSFLIGAYQYLLDWYLASYMQDAETHSKGKAARIRPSLQGAWRLTTAEKKRILLEHIYGVDIDAQAVEVTKLSLLLKMLEGESDESLNSQMKLFHERILPDLERNIQCGNSLIGPDFYDGQLDLDLDDEAVQRINVFDWPAAFPEVFKKDGFDAVIGNPPYVRQEALKGVKKYFQEKYCTYHGGADLYTYFVEKGISLLKKDGVFSVIVSNKWLKVEYGKPLRQWLTNKKVEEVIDFVDLPVFKKATTYTCILSVTHNSPSMNIRIAKIQSLNFTDLEDYVTEQSYTIKHSALDNNGWHLANLGVSNIQNKLREAGQSLSHYVNGAIYYGVKTGCNDAFVINSEMRAKLIAQDKRNEEIIKPFLVGLDIKRYQPVLSSRFVLFTRRGIDIKKYPTIEAYLLKFKEGLMPKPKDWQGANWPGRKSGSYQWYELQDTVNYFAEFERPKIIWPGISPEVTAFALDNKGIYGNDNNQMIISGDYFLLGILNSKAIKFFLQNICDKVQGGFYRLKMAYIEQIAIPPIDFSNSHLSATHKQISTLVEKILTLNVQRAATKTPQDKNQIQRQIDATDRQIDQLVYALYGLTEEEIALVEGS